MKVIDEKGRLFGKINLIDLLVLLLVVAVVVLLAGKFLGDGGMGGGNSGTKLTYTVKVANVSDEVYQSLSTIPLPDQLMAAGDMLNGKVISMSEAPGSGAVYVVPNQTGIEMKTMETNTHDLTFTIEAYVANATKNELGTQEIRLGKTHIVKTQNMEFERGVITSLVKEAPAA